MAGSWKCGDASRIPENWEIVEFTLLESGLANAREEFQIADTKRRLR
jgi:hypothetical protein